MIIVKNRFTINNYVSTLNGNNFACILITKIFDPGPENSCSKFTADIFFQSGFAYFNFLGEVKDFENVFIAFITNCP